MNDVIFYAFDNVLSMAVRSIAMFMHLIMTDPVVPCMIHGIPYTNTLSLNKPSVRTLLVQNFCYPLQTFEFLRQICKINLNKINSLIEN